MHVSQSVSAVIAATSNPSPVVTVKSFAVAGDGLARVVVDVVHTSESRSNPSLIANALRARLQNKMDVVQGSFKCIDKGPLVDTITGLVGKVRQIVSVSDDQQLNSFKAFASNMYLDDEERMWKLHRTATGRVLVQSNGIEDDMSLLDHLESCSSAGASSTSNAMYRAVASACSEAQAAQGGDYVTYVDDSTLRQGFVLASIAGTDKLVVLAHDAEQYATISKFAVTEVHDTAQFPNPVPTDAEQVEMAVAASRGVDIEFLLNYYKKVYSRSPEFFAKFAANLRRHAFF